MICRSTILLALTLVALTGAVRAAPLCGAQCEVSIDFPDGGRMVAQDFVTITFGDSGLIDTVGSVTAYVDGETLVLNPGARLLFGSGGRFDLGSGGNIDFTDLEIFSGGLFNVTAVGGSETVEIAPGNTLSVFGNADLIIKAATFSVGGSLELSANGRLSLYNDLATGCGVTAHATDAVRISLVTVAVTADNDACARLLDQAFIEVIDPGASDDPPPQPSPGSSDSTAFPPWLAAFLLVLTAAALRRAQKRKLAASPKNAERSRPEPPCAERSPSNSISRSTKPI